VERITDWSIESIGRAESEVQGTPPSEEEMEGLLPDEWPSNWVELERSTGVGHARVAMAHPNPDPGGPGKVFNPETDSMTSKYDFVQSLFVQGYPNEPIAKQNFENYKTFPTQGPGASILGASEGLTVGEALETFAPGELSEEAKALLEEVPAELEKHGTEFSKGKIPRKRRDARGRRGGGGPYGGVDRQLRHIGVTPVRLGINGPWRHTHPLR